MAWWIFQNLVVTSVLAGVVALICRFGRIGPVGRHALWVLVLVKFVTPPLVVWPWTAPDPLGVSRIDARAVVREIEPGPTASAGSGEPGASDVFTQGLGARPLAAALRAKRPAPIMTLGFDVLVQDVIAAITTSP